MASEIMEGTLKVPHVKGIKAGWRKVRAAAMQQQKKKIVMLRS